MRPRRYRIATVINFYIVLRSIFFVRHPVSDVNAEIGQIQAKGSSGEGRRPKWRRIKPPRGEG
ncbi:hypothetical protein JHK86_044871 [Glycine max]|nr:hypothetical protein JHK86_044871 [Glycine max]